MFTSLMIILLAFFIMLSSLAVIDERREQNVLGSLIGAFGILPKGLSAIKGKGGSLAPTSEVLDDIKSDTEHMKRVLTHEIVEDKITVLKGSTRRIISIQNTVFFAEDGVELLPEKLPLLKKLAEILSKSDYPIIIKGHTDNQPPQDEALINNWYVSSSRAANILKYFIEEGGLDPNRLTAFGYSEYRPLVVNTTRENRAKNRRIELVLDTSHRVAIRQYNKESWAPKKLNFKGFYFDLFGKKQEP